MSLFYTVENMAELRAENRMQNRSKIGQAKYSTMCKGLLEAWEVESL